VRYYRSPELRAMSAALAAGFGISGVYVPEFVIHQETGEPYLLEINRRMTHGTHRGAARKDPITIDVCGRCPPGNVLLRNVQA
jgi:hypothetical protein